MQLSARFRIKNQLWRFDPDTGFLRCTAVILQNSVMPYLRQEIGAPPEVAPAAETLHILVSRDAISEPASLASIEGVPAVEGHIWQTTDTVKDSCGAIAGAPYFDGCDLTADILVTDRDIARRIMLPAGDAEKLEEISTGFDALVNWTPGTAECGPYDGYFSQIRYNHVAILPAGRARGGGAVRIINTPELPKMEFTRIKLASGRTVRVHNEDVPLVEDDAKATEDKVKNAIDPGKMQELMAQLEELNKQLADTTKERDSIAGQLQALKDQLDAALGADAIEAAADEMAAERDDAATVMNSRGKELTADARKLRGHPLRLHVVNSLRAEPLAEDKAKNEAFVEGLYAAMRDTAPAAATPPAGHKVVNTAPGAVQNPAPAPRTNKDRFDAMYGPKKTA